MLDLVTGVWQPGPGVLFELTQVLIEASPPPVLSLASTAITLVLHAQGGSSLIPADAAGLRSPMSPGDQLVLLPAAPFLLPVRVVDLRGTDGQIYALQCRLPLRVYDPQMVAWCFVREDREVLAEWVSLLLGAESAIRLATWRALRAEQTVLPAALAEELRDALALFGLALAGEPSDLRLIPYQPLTGQLRVGQVVDGRWWLVERLGQGTHGEAWQAERSGMPGLLRVLKFIRTPLQARAAQHGGQWLALAEGANLNWHYLCRLVESAGGDVPYLVYEYINGPDLWQYAAVWGGTFPLDVALAIIGQVLGGLDELHRSGLVHGNLHPGNVKIAQQPPNLLIKLLDCGVPPPEPQQAAWGRGGVAGRALAAAEEEGELPHAQSDLYGAGLLLWWLLTGGRSLPIGVGLRETWPDGSPDLADVVWRACLAEPPARFASVAEMAQTLTLIANGERLPPKPKVAPAQPQSEVPAPVDPVLTLRPDGDGDAAGLEEAIRQAKPGTVIRLLAGTYRLREPLQIEKPVAIVGAGRDHTRIVCAGPKHVLRFAGRGPFALVELSLSHEGSQAADVVVANGEVLFDRCRIRGGVRIRTEDRARGGLLRQIATGVRPRGEEEIGQGIWLHGEARGRVSGCEIFANQADGIGVAGQSQPVLEGNICQENGGCGIAYYDTAAGAARQNTCTGNERAGIGVGQHAAPSLEANLCQGNAGYGIGYYDNASGTAQQNTCAGNERDGIAVGGGAQPALESNLCQENAASGIGYRDGAAGSARQNACTANARAGIAVSGEAQPVLEANNCYQNAEYGIQYADAASGVARQNSCTANGKDGIALAGLAQPTLEANSCQGNAWCGIGYGGKAAGSARQNTCAGNVKDGIGMADEAQPLLLSNLCRENAWCGIAFYSAATGVARRNECAANGGDGIAASGQAMPLIEANACRENAWNGIFYRNNSAGSGSQNVCTANRQHGISVDGQAQPALEANTCQDNVHVGIAYDDHAGGSLRQNSCSGNDIGIQIAATADPALSANRSSGNRTSDLADARYRTA